jgi:hypothetical protein
MSSSIGTRPSTSNAVVANTPFVTETFVNRCLPTSNNSAVLQFDHRFAICAGQETYLPFKCTDPDGDSLSFRLGSIKQAPGVNAVYVSPYSINNPFPYLGNYGPPFPSLSNSIDGKNGYIKFTPLGAFKESIIIEALEWRKVNGVNTLAGLTRYDFLLVSQVCTSNQPAIDVYYQETLEQGGKVNWDVCVEALEPVCFTIKSKSINTIPAATTLKADSNAYFTITQLGNDSLKVCLSSQAISSSVNPITLNLFAKEATCPTLAQRGRTIIINKFSKPSQLLRARSIGSFNRILTLEALNNIPINKASTIWQIETAPNSQQYTTIATGDSCLYLFPGPGIYKLRTIVSGTSCNATITHILKVESFSVKDSILEQVLCKNKASARVMALVNNAIGKVQYKLNNGPLQDTALFENLVAGNYLLYANDSLGQKDSILFTITQPDSELVIKSISSQNPNCHGQNTGFLQISASGGIAPLKFGLNQSNLNANPLFENLAAGEYLIKALDNNNCMVFDTVKLTQPDPIQIQFTTQADSCTNPASGKISCNISGGTMPYYLNWINYNQSGQTELDKLSQGYYYLRVTDQKACVKNDTAFVPLSNYVFTEEICTINFLHRLSPTNALPGIEITWFKSPNKRIASYQIWVSANDTAQFLLEKTIPAFASEKFIDSSDWFYLSERKYKLISVDSCGRTSSFSKIAEPLALTTGNSPNGGFYPMLTWVKPNFNSLVLEYEIYRRKPGNFFSLIKILDSNDFSFIDSSSWGQGYNFEYFIRASLMNNCQVSYIQSEIKPWATLGVGERLNPASGFSLYPNPAKHQVTLKSLAKQSFTQVQIRSIEGKLIETYLFNQAKEEAMLQLPPLSKGLYHVYISNEGTLGFTLPIMIE